jgi:hypothetical protein
LVAHSVRASTLSEVFAQAVSASTFTSRRRASSNLVPGEVWVVDEAGDLEDGFVSNGIPATNTRSIVPHSGAGVSDPGAVDDAQTAGRPNR